MCHAAEKGPFDPTPVILMTLAIILIVAFFRFTDAALWFLGPLTD
jgi:hypothetical protein